MGAGQSFCSLRALWPSAPIVPQAPKYHPPKVDGILSLRGVVEEVGTVIREHDGYIDIPVLF